MNKTRGGDRNRRKPENNNDIFLFMICVLDYKLKSCRNGYCVKTITLYKELKNSTKNLLQAVHLSVLRNTSQQ